VATQISKKRKFVADGVFYAELNQLFRRELSEQGYSGVEVRPNPLRTDIVIRATHPKDVVGEKGRRLRELTTVVQQRFNFPDGAVELFAEMVNNKGLCAQAQCESIKHKLLGGLAVRRAAYGVMRLIMESGAKGCQIIVSGKLRGARAKGMKFGEGYMIKSGGSKEEYIVKATCNVLMRQGMLGIRVTIMLPHDPAGKEGPSKPLADIVTVMEPKDIDGEVAQI
jgi:small subunit ribosomal protein S3e